MRYYYGLEEQKRKRRMQENVYEIPKQRKMYDTLVVEEDTVYEIDEACMRRRKEER